MTSWIFALVASVVSNVPSDYTLLQFGSEQCGPCQQMQPTVLRLVDEGWVVRQIQVEREDELVKRWRVTQIPTLVVLQKGKEVDRMVGVVSYDKLRDRLVPTGNTSSSRIVRGQSDFPDKNGFDVSMVSRNSALTSHAAAPSPVSFDAQAATVRIRVDDGRSESVGTGTMIDRHGQDVLVLTCGHLFRDNRGQAPVTIETFVKGKLQQIPAQVIDYRADDTDIGLLTFRTTGEVEVAKLFPRNENLREGQEVFSYGCDGGSEPTRRDSQITKLNRYLGPANIEVRGAPKQGRSGGGLFNAQGYLIGVCYAADAELDEGLYSGPEVVYQQINRLGLSRLYESHQSSLTSQPANINSSDEFSRDFSSKAKNLDSRTKNVSNAPTLPAKEIIAIVRQPGSEDRVFSIPNATASLLNSIETLGSPLSSVK